MKIDTFKITPNYIHGIIVLNEVGATLAVAQGGTPSLENTDVAPPSIPDDNCFSLSVMDDKKSDADLQANRATARVAPTTISTAPIAATTESMSDIIGAYKSLVANKCLETFKAKHSPVFLSRVTQKNKGIENCVNAPKSKNNFTLCECRSLKFTLGDPVRKTGRVYL